MQPTLEMLISDHFMLAFPTYLYHDACGVGKKAVAQAVPSWNEWLTYKGLSAQGGEAAGQKYTRELSVTGCLLSDETGKVELHYFRGFLKGWVENQNLSCRVIEMGPGKKM